MKDIKKYQGVIPAFYACYDAEGNISTEGVKALTRHLIAKGVKGVYVGGSSGECIYQHVDERKAVLEAVMSEAKGKLTVIAHVGCNNTADSVELARHAESVGVDAIASIPPIYFHLPEYAIAKVLERYVRCCSQHRVRHLQHPAAGRHRPDHEPAEGNCSRTPM